MERMTRSRSSMRMPFGNYLRERKISVVSRAQGRAISVDNTPVCVHNSERRREHMSYSWQRWILDHWMLDGCRELQPVKLQQSKSSHRMRRHCRTSIKSFVLRRCHNLTRHLGVQAFFCYQETKEGEARKSMALSVARCFRKSVYFARKVVAWEGQWIEHRKIEIGERGYFAKTRS